MTEDLMNGELIKKYNEFQENFPYKHKFYHRNSLRNFIVNFEKLKNFSPKQNAYDLLIHYIDYISELK